MKKLLGLTSKLLTTGFTTCVLSLGLSQAIAVELMPDFSTAPTGWTTDRYAPTSFSNVGTFQGRNNVLGIGITSAGNLANRPAAYQSTFYNTQGRQYQVAGGASSSISADLWIPTNWRDSANGSFRSDMWGVMTDGSSVTDYPIVGFTDYGGASRFRVWDQDNGGWIDLATTVNYGAWNSLSIDFTGSSYVYSINGVVAFTDSTIGGSTGFQAIIMQAYNFADPNGVPGANPVDYTADWSNAQGVPDGGATVMLLGATCAGLSWMRRRSMAS
jgi:hypothetical protein